MKKRLALIFATIVLSITLLSFGQAGNYARTLTGRVFDRQDQPLAKAVVYLKNTKSLAVKAYISGRMAVVVFQGSPNVDFEVYAEHNGARSDTKTLSAFDSRKVVNITLRVK